VSLGYLLYVMAIAFLVMFWRARRGRSTDELLVQSARDHHDVLAILAKHAQGGTWREYLDWRATERSNIESS